jgi:hypothetical protein
MGLDCIFGVLIPVISVDRVEGSGRQVLIHTYDVMLLFGLRSR